MDWDDLIGRWAVLNSFGLVYVAAVEGDSVIIGEGSAQTSIPMAIIRSVRLLREDGAAGPTVATTPAEPVTFLPLSK